MSEIVWRGARAKPGAPGAPVVDHRANDQLGAHYEGSSGALEGEEAPLLSVDVETVKPLAVTLFEDCTIARGPGAVVNGAALARVTYIAGLSGKVHFDCDWMGGFLVLAQKLDIARVAYRPDAITCAYGAQPISIGANVAIGGPRPPHAPTYTVPPAAVAIGATRVVPLPLFARRVQLLTIYGDGGASGDIPSGQLFLAFMSSAGGVLQWIDALSAREVFGGGLSVPHGAVSVALTNRSADASVCLGAIFHLSI
jgi:hypothetical protein